MKLYLLLRAVMASFSDALVREFDHLIIQINGWAEKEHHTDGTHGDITVTGFTFGGETQTTVGAAGGASALPATPSGYLTITVDATEYVVPYYAKS
jgi:hypothetical protein